MAGACSGQTIRVASGGDLADTFRRVLSDFRSRYVLAFTPRDVEPGGAHRLDVRVKRPNLTVKARPGYIGVGPSAFPGPDVKAVQEMQERAPNLKDINMRAIVGWTLAGVVADALKRSDGVDGAALRKALEQTDVDVHGAIPGSHWTYTATSHAPTRKSVFYQVKNGKIEKISEPIDPPVR